MQSLRCRRNGCSAVEGAAWLDIHALPGGAWLRIKKLDRGIAPPGRQPAHAEPRRAPPAHAGRGQRTEVDPDRGRAATPRQSERDDPERPTDQAVTQRRPARKPGQQCRGSGGGARPATRSKHVARHPCVNTVAPAQGRADRLACAKPAGAVGHNSVRSAQSSGKSSTSSMRRRYCTPEVPPVPRLTPITRSTVVTWLNRQRRK